MANGGAKPQGIGGMDVLSRLSKWATSGPATEPSADGEIPKGCFSPLSIVKIVVFVLMIVLCPLFLLPIMIARLVRVGFTGLKESAAIELSSGQDARWGHGALEPSAGAGDTRAAIAAIASRDPGFRMNALTDWAASATGLICQSMASGDPTPARTFMGNGLFRTHQALLELRDRTGVRFSGQWRALDTALIGAASTPLFDEVRVRVRCEGWRWEQHAPSGLTLRGGPDGAAWSEDLTFGRSAGTLTPSAGGLPARRCPSCGADLTLDSDGVCLYCQGVVTAGRHDWVLVSWQREPW